MLITNIKVTDLYGLHNYDIAFDKEECLKIIHAPNGYGKTTILKLIRAILEGYIDELQQIPFKRFMIVCDPAITVEVYKENNEMYYHFISGQFEETYQVGLDKNAELSASILNRLKSITKEMPIYLINADRLWLEKKEYTDAAHMFLPTVLEYAKELSELMREALAQSNYCGQELDRSFPNRLIKRLNDTEASYLSIEEIREQLQELENKRTILESAGLFSNVPVALPEELSQVDEKILKVLTLYIEDSHEKLRAFESLATKINLLATLINKRFSYKVMEVNMKDGFVFKVPTKEKLRADKLSSGEQNELILLFKLLFKSPANALILIDEPEISLHIAWQQSFLEDMEAIAALTKVKLIIATHSPDIINGRWDLTTGLEEC